MQSDQHIKRLIRELCLPEEADQVIQRPKYWTPAFCWLYFERCDELVFDDPQTGLQAAEVTPELVELVGRFSRSIELRGPLQIRALAVLGSALRAFGDLERSEETYDKALKLIKAEAVSGNDRANLLFRVSVLRRSQNRLAEALDLSDQSVAIYRDSTSDIRERHLGEALTIRGRCHQLLGNTAAAVKDWSEALSCTDPRKRPRVHYAASNNLVTSLVEGAADPRSLSRVESHLRQARRFLSKRPRSVQKLRLIWLQGMIMIRFGSTRRGEVSLRSARAGFIEMEAWFDMALVSLELGRYLYQSRQYIELRTLAAETCQIFSAQRCDERAARALSVWKDSVAAHTIPATAFASAWRELQKRAALASR
ncbi:MAG: tetratricopeptide repeat protein [bacterium]|nr:tetratricopeptide repeat protein [bacterium]